MWRHQGRTTATTASGGKLSVTARAIDAQDRQAEIFEFEVEATHFRPGLYTCQVNVIDAVAGQVAFPRLLLYVRASEKAAGK